MTFRRAPFRGCAALLAALAGACTAADRGANKAESIRQGDELSSQQRYVEAVAAYRTAVNADPKDARLHMKLAETAMLAGDLRQAEREAAQASFLLPGDDDARLRSASFMLLQGRFDEVADHLTTFLRDHPDHVNALIVWGNATAHFVNSTEALYKLADVVGDRDKLESARNDIRPRVSPSDEASAEKAFRRARELAPAMLEAQLAVVNDLWATGRLDESLPALTDIADRNPLHDVANYAVGRLELARQRIADAERHLRNAAAGSPDLSRRARIALVDYYARANRYGEVRSVLASMNPADDASGDLSVRLAAEDMRSGNPREAVRRLDALLARVPQHAPALLLKAEILFAMGNPGLRFAQAAVAAAPASSDARSILARALSGKGDLEDAADQYLEAWRLNPGAKEPVLELALLSLALDRTPTALQYAKDAMLLDPSDAGAALAFVKALILKQDYAQADVALKPLLSRVPELADALVQAGTLQAVRGNDGAARAAFLRALQADPDSLDALSGLVSLDQNGPTAASTQQRVAAAVAAHPRDPGYLVLAARVDLAAKDTARAETALREAVGIDGASVKAARSLADLLAGSHRPDEAARVLEQLVDRRPRSLEARTALAMLLEDTGHQAEAQTLYEQVVAENPHAATALYRLSWLYARTSNLDLALNLASAAKQETPADPAVSDLIGWIYSLKDLPRLALPQLKDAVAAAPGNALFHFHLGSTYERGGDIALALTEFRRALQIDGTFQGADEAREFIATYGKQPVTA